MAKFPFNVRAYGIYIDSNNNVLLTEENRFNMFMRKFPGGGLKFGEGLKDCIKREWKEETGTELKEIKHFYTTDFFQKSYFNPEEQIISVYFLVKPETENFTVKENNLKLIRIPLPELTEEMLTFPIDKYVLQLLKSFLQM